MKSIVYLLVLSLLWGSSFFWTKGLLDFFQPSTIVFLRCLFGLIALIPFVILSKERFNWKVSPLFLLVVALAAAIPWNFVGFSLKGIDSSLSGILNATTPLLAVILTIILLKEKPLRNQLFSLVIGFCAVVALLIFSGNAVGAEFSILHALLMFVATTSHALNSIYINKKYLHVPPLQIAFWTLAVAVMMNAPIVLITEPDFVFRLWNIQALVPLLILGCLCSGLAYAIYYLIISLSGPLLAMMVTFMIPFVSITLGVIFLKEPLHIGIAIGLPLMMISLILMNIHLFKFMKKSQGSLKGEQL